jgi:2-polyprenyl-3-methyl-5-hydroxy-6-metoxy-1,4-benzoquinol methylase
MMDSDGTLKFYRDNASLLITPYDRFVPAYVAHLKALLRGKTASVIEVACGAGRTVAELLADGLDANGVDCSREVIAAGQAHYRLPEDRIWVDALPQLRSVSRRYDAVLCAGALHHIADRQLLDALYRLRSLVAPQGFLMLSVPLSYPVGPDSCDRLGRIVRLRPTAQYRFFLERLGMREIVAYEEEDCLKRDAVTWGVLLFSATRTDDLRPIHVIESVLWDDR